MGFSPNNGGGIGIDAGSVLRYFADGPQLFAGTTAAPTLLAGTYALAPTSGYSASTLTITSVAAAVPEPSSWALMIGGLGLVGGRLRRARGSRAANRRLQGVPA